MPTRVRWSEKYVTQFAPRNQAVAILHLLHFVCTQSRPNFESRDIERSVLIQVRELSMERYSADSPEKIRASLAPRLRLLNYFHQYRRTYLVLRKAEHDLLHSSFTVMGTDQLVGGIILKLTIVEFAFSQVEDVPELNMVLWNRSDEVPSLQLLAIRFLTGSRDDGILFRSCPHVSKKFRVAFSSTLLFLRPHFRIQREVLPLVFAVRAVVRVQVRFPSRSPGSSHPMGDPIRFSSPEVYDFGDSSHNSMPLPSTIAAFVA